MMSKHYCFYIEPKNLETSPRITFFCKVEIRIIEVEISWYLYSSSTVLRIDERESLIEAQIVSGIACCSCRRGKRHSPCIDKKKSCLAILILSQYFCSILNLYVSWLLAWQLICANKRGDIILCCSSRWFTRGKHVEGERIISARERRWATVHAYYSFPSRPLRAVSTPMVTNIFELTGRILPAAVSVEIARHLSQWFRFFVRNFMCCRGVLFSCSLYGKGFQHTKAGSGERGRNHAFALLWGEQWLPRVKRQLTGGLPFVPYVQVCIQRLAGCGGVGWEAQEAIADHSWSDGRLEGRSKAWY